MKRTITVLVIVALVALALVGVAAPVGADSYHSGGNCSHWGGYDNSDDGPSFIYFKGALNQFPVHWHRYWSVPLDGSAPHNILKPC